MRGENFYEEFGIETGMTRSAPFWDKRRPERRTSTNTTDIGRRSLKGVSTPFWGQAGGFDEVEKTVEPFGLGNII